MDGITDWENICSKLVVEGTAPVGRRRYPEPC